MNTIIPFDPRRSGRYDGSWDEFSDEFGDCPPWGAWNLIHKRRGKGWVLYAVRQLPGKVHPTSFRIAAFENLHALTILGCALDNWKGHLRRDPHWTPPTPGAPL